MAHRKLSDAQLLRERNAHIDARRAVVREHALRDDQAFFNTLGSQERFHWHDYRKEVDPTHLNPYRGEFSEAALAPTRKALAARKAS